MFKNGRVGGKPLSIICVNRTKLTLSYLGSWRYVLWRDLCLLRPFWTDIPWSKRWWSTIIALWSSRRCSHKSVRSRRWRNFWIEIDGLEVSRVQVAKFLGVLVDDKLSRSNDINLFVKMSQNISVIYKVKHMLENNHLLYCSLILPNLSYEYATIINHFKIKICCYNYV